MAGHPGVLADPRIASRLFKLWVITPTGLAPAPHDEQDAAAYILAERYEPGSVAKEKYEDHIWRASRNARRQAQAL